MAESVCLGTGRELFCPSRLLRLLLLRDLFHQEETIAGRETCYISLDVYSITSVEGVSVGQKPTRGSYPGSQNSCLLPWHADVPTSFAECWFELHCGSQ